MRKERRKKAVKNSHKTNDYRNMFYNEEIDEDATV